MILEFWKTLEFGLCESWRVPEKNILMSVRTLEDRSNCSRDILIFHFQDGGRPPSWICFTRVGTTHEEYLVVFMTVQNLVVIGAVISIVCKF